MKHIKEFIIFLSLFFSNYIFSQQPNISFDFLISGGKDETFKDIIKTSDGNYLVSYLTRSTNGNVAACTNPGQYLANSALAKISPNGTILWQICFQEIFNSTSHISNIYENTPNVYTFTNYQQLPGDNDTFPYFIRVNSNGQIIESTKLSSGTSQSLLFLNDGRFLTYNVFGISNGLIRLFNSNKTPTNVLFPNLSGYSLRKIIQINDGNLIAVGTKGFQCWISKINIVTGQFMWEKTFGSTGTDLLTDVVKLPNGKVACVGWAGKGDGDFANTNFKSSPYNGYNMLFCVIGSNLGAIEFKRCYGTTSSFASGFGSSIQLLSNGLILLGGGVSGTSGDAVNHPDGYPYLRSAWLVAVDDVGNIHWQKRFGGNYDEHAELTKVTNNDEILVLDYFKRYFTPSEYSADLRILKLDNPPSALPCPNQLNLTGSILNDVGYYAETINSVNTIENNRNLILNSKWVTDLQPGFKAESGTTFKAEIKNCY
jgi:hypothetical protein